MSLSNIIFETADYAVVVGEMNLKPGKGQTGYIVYNKTHGVREGEVTVEYAAITAAQELQKSRDDVYKKEDEDSETAELEELFDSLHTPGNS